MVPNLQLVALVAELFHTPRQVNAAPSAFHRVEAREKPRGDRSIVS
jgi:hypothetical protein